MPTDKRTHANRQNAKRTTGPRTPEAKARACLNAVHHAGAPHSTQPKSPHKQDFQNEPIMGNYPQETTPLTSPKTNP
jgi:hypothetical protein